MMLQSTPSSAQSPLPTIVYLSGAPLHSASMHSTSMHTALSSSAVADRALVEALARSAHVVWVDPIDTDPSRSRATGIHRLSPTLTRVHTVLRGFPGVPSTRGRARRALGRSVSAALAELGTTSDAVVLSDPTGRFPDDIDGHRLFYVTSDWVSGAHRSSRKAVRRSIEINAARADTVAAVSDILALRLHMYSKTMDAVRVVPAGCTVESTDGPAPDDLPTRCPVVVCGDFDAHLDYDLLDAVASTGLRILAIGARAADDDETGLRIDRFLARPNVHWLGGRPDSARRNYLSTASVGIAPSKVDAFTRAGSPALILEYLASGLAVVASDLPSARRFSDEHVMIADSPAQFADCVRSAVTAVHDAAARTSRTDVAAAQSWDVRATVLLRLMALYREQSEARRFALPPRPRPIR